jgi:hypothetical protein
VLDHTVYHFHHFSETERVLFELVQQNSTTRRRTANFPANHLSTIAPPLSNISFFPPSYALSCFMTVTSSKVSFGDVCLVMRVEP